MTLISGKSKETLAWLASIGVDTTLLPAKRVTITIDHSEAVTMVIEAFVTAEALARADIELDGLA